MISLRYAITKEDYINFYTYLQWDAADKKKRRVKYYFQQILINGGIIALLIYFDVFRYSTGSLYLYVTILTAITILRLASARATVKKQASKIVDSGENNIYFSENLVDVADTGIHIKSESFETRYNWNAFARKEETPDYYFLFISSMQAIIFPKRIFKNDDRKQFEKLLNQHLSVEAEVGHLIGE